MKVLSYQLEPEVCANMRGRIQDMPKVQKIISEFHFTLRKAYTLIEDSEMDNDWRDSQFLDIKTKALRTMTKELEDYRWVTEDFISKCYHD